jgi:hypothetical protein
MSGNKQICVITNHTEYSVTRKLLSALETEWDYDVIKASSLHSYEFINEFKSGIIILYTISAQHLRDLLEYAEDNDFEKIRIIVVSKSSNLKVEKIIRAKGCSALFNISTPSKNILNKVEELYTTLNQKDRASIKEVASINLSADCWILEQSSHIKKVNGMWCIYLIGPSANTGIWEMSSEIGKENYWEFIANDPIHETLKGEQGVWFYKGNKPRLQNFHWQFIGERPELLYYLGGITEIYKFKLESKDKILNITRNSEQAKKKLPLLEESHLNLYKYGQKAKRIQDLKGIISSSFQDNITDKLRGNVRKVEVQKPINLNEDSKNFIVIDSLKEKKLYLNKLSNEKGSRLVVWTKGQKLILDANAKIIKEGQYKINFLNEKVGSQLVSQLEKKEISNVFLRGDMSEGSVFFSLEGPTFNIDEITILVPKLMWKVQRRRVSRLRLDGRKRIKANIKLIGTNRIYNITAPVRDIGSGGMALLIDDIHQSLFTSGKVIKEIKFMLNNEMFFASANVKWKGPLHKKDQLANYNYSIGLEFMYMSQKDSEYITRYVLEELHTIDGM